MTTKEILKKKNLFAIFSHLFNSPKSIIELMSLVFREKTIDEQRLKIICKKCNHQNLKKVTDEIRNQLEKPTKKKKNKNLKPYWIDLRCGKCRGRLLSKRGGLNKANPKIIKGRTLPVSIVKSRYSSFKEKIKLLETSKIIWQVADKYQVNYKAILVYLFESMENQQQDMKKFGQYLYRKTIVSHNSALLNNKEILLRVFYSPVKLLNEFEKPKTFEDYLRHIILFFAQYGEIKNNRYSSKLADIIKFNFKKC